jgi:hypothetical protein
MYEISHRGTTNIRRHRGRRGWWNPELFELFVQTAYSKTPDRLISVQFGKSGCITLPKPKFITYYITIQLVPHKCAPITKVNRLMLYRKTNVAHYKKMHRF